MPNRKPPYLSPYRKQERLIPYCGKCAKQVPGTALKCPYCDHVFPVEVAK